MWNALEDRIELILANGKHGHAMPGEKTDCEDGKRLANMLGHGLIRPGRHGVRERLRPRNRATKS